MTEYEKSEAHIVVWKTTRNKARALCKKYGISYNIFILYSVDLFEREVAKVNGFNPTKVIKKEDKNEK